MDECSFCKKEKNDFWIADLEVTKFFVGDHQYFNGYCYLVLNKHVVEITDLSIPDSNALMNDLKIATAAIKKAFNFHKMNISSFGNVVPHLHWHLMPRHNNDPDLKDHPWKNASLFQNHSIDASLARSLAVKIRSCML